MADENDDNVDDKKDDKPKASDKEVADLIKALSARNKELEDENADYRQNYDGLKGEVSKLQETLGTQSSMAELVDQLKTLNADRKQPMTEQEKAASEILKAAEAGDMKTYRKLREEQQA